MSDDVFISYARSTASQAQLIDDTLQSLGYSVWRDQELPLHRPYPQVIEERLRSARAVLVIWSKDAAASDWVRSEADLARLQDKLIQVSVDQTPPPMPFNQIQCGDLAGWSGDVQARGWRKLMASLSDLAQPDPPPPAASEVPAEGPADGRTIAVLPFVNVSSDPEQEYFSDGLADELMAQLAQLPGLRVTGRASAFAYKGDSEDLRSIGRTLGVAHILEGSVRKSGKRLRVTAQLVASTDGYQMWSQTFDRELDDVFAIQEEVARAVTEALGVTLGTGAHAPDYGGTRSFEAFDQFLKGRFLAGIQLNRQQFDARARHLRKAVSIDPSYAVAWAHLSVLLAYTQTGLPAGEARNLDAERDEAARRALAMAPDLPVANVAQGWGEADKRNWRAADAAFMRALQRGPGRDAHSEGIIGAYLTDVGRIREGLALRERARDSDPLWLGWSAHVLRSYLTLGLWDAFESEYRRSQDLEGHRGLVEYLQLMRLWVTHADRTAIAAQYERAGQGRRLSGPLAALSDALTPQEASATLRRSLGGPPAELFLLAQVAGVRGDVDLAIEALEKATPDARLVLFQGFWLPELREARNDPRFKDLIHAVGLAQFWRASGKWPDLCRPLGDEDFEFIG